MAKNSSKEKEPDLKEEFEEEIKKPYYDVFYLDNFKLPKKKLDVSIVIPTYNRCPYNPESMKRELNPLAWAIKSCLLQKPAVSEIIIIDDHSTDYTKKVVEGFKKEAEGKEIDLVYIRNNKNMDYAKSANLGAAAANSKYLLFVDDDSIVAPYAAFGAVFSYEWLKENGINIGLLNLAPYARTSIPNKVSKISEIGNLDFAKGILTANKNAFPEEYLGDIKDKFIHQEYHILKPIQIKNTGGYFLCSNKLFTELEGIPITVFARHRDTSFGCRVLENGYSIFLSPDPKFHCVHGSYGLKTGKQFEGEDWFRKLGGQISLKKAMKESDNPKQDTGSRIDLNTVLYNSILSFFAMSYKRNTKGAARWMSKVHKEFVENGDASILNGDVKISIPEKERKEMWSRAIKNGIDFIEKTEKEKLKKVKQIRKNLESEKGKTPNGNIINNLFDL